MNVILNNETGHKLIVDNSNKRIYIFNIYVNLLIIIQIIRKDKL